MLNHFGYLFLLLALAWIGQLALSLLQTRRFYQRVAELRKGSFASAVGLAGNNWKRKIYGVLVVDRDLTITAAGMLSGSTVFARLKLVPALKKLPIERFETEKPVEGISKKQWNAFQNAASYIRSHMDTIESSEEPDVQSGEDEAGAVMDAGKEELVRG